MGEKTGLLLVNLGSPDAPTAGAVKRYLKQFLSDRNVIEMSPILWWPILHGIILRTRPAKSAGLYAKIWRKDENGAFAQEAPLVEIVRAQKRALGAVLPDDTVVELAMRYGKPSLKTGLTSLMERGCKQITVFPLYPQYARATTGSVIDETNRIVAKFTQKPEIRYIKDYHRDGGYIQALADAYRAHVKQLGWVPDKILVSFHGIPKSSSAKGDPYEMQCQQTFELLAKALTDLKTELGLCYQSRFGPKEWLGPYIADCLRELAAQGQRVVVITPGFSADCLETLEEIAIKEKQDFLVAGGEKYSYVPCLNDGTAHIKALAKIAKAGA